MAWNRLFFFPLFSWFFLFCLEPRLEKLQEKATSKFSTPRMRCSPVLDSIRVPYVCSYLFGFAQKFSGALAYRAWLSLHHSRICYLSRRQHRFRCTKRKYEKIHELNQTFANFRNDTSQIIFFVNFCKLSVNLIKHWSPISPYFQDLF